MVAARSRPGAMVRIRVEISHAALERAKERLRGAAARVHQHRVTVGLHETVMGKAKRDYQGKDTQSTLGEVMAAHEFGAGPVPARSWLRDWFDERRAELAERMKAAMHDEYEHYTTGLRRSPAMLAFAQDTLAGLIARLRAGLEPELSPATKRARKRAGLPEGPPLVATEQFVSALGARVDGFDVSGKP